MIRRNYGSGNMIEKKAHALETCQTNATLLMLHDPLLLGVTTNKPFPNEKLFMEAVNPLIYLTATGNQAPHAHRITQLNHILQNDILGNCHLIFSFLGPIFCFEPKFTLPFCSKRVSRIH